MGVFDSLLGGGGDQEVKTKIEYPKWWLDLYRPTLESLNPIYQHQAQQPIHPLAQMAYQGIAQTALNGSPMRQQGMDYISQLLGGPAPGRGPPPGTSDPAPGGNPLAGIDWSGQIPKPNPDTVDPNPKPQPIMGGRNPDPATIQTVLNSLEKVGAPTGVGRVGGIEDPEMLMNVLAQRRRLQRGW